MKVNEADEESMMKFIKLTVTQPLVPQALSWVSFSRKPVLYGIIGCFWSQEESEELAESCLLAEIWIVLEIESSCVIG